MQHSGMARAGTLAIALIAAWCALASQAMAAATGLQFDDSGGYVTMGPAPALGADTFTLECWFKRQGAGVSSSSGSGGVIAIPLICKGRGEIDGDTRDCNYFFGIRESDGVLAADFEDMADGTNHPVAGLTPIQNDVWYHAAATYDGATWRLYLNGVLDAQFAVNAVPRYDSIQHFSLATAINSTGATEGSFYGILDEVRVWNYARSVAQIRAAINTEIANDSGLLGRWGMNEASGTAVIDSTGHGNDGTMVNGGWTAGAPFDLNIPPDTPTPLAPANGSDVAAGNVALRVHVVDAESDPLQVKFYGRKLSPGLPPPFTIVAVPDTQNYSMTYPATFTSQVQWIVDHRQAMNIAYVAHEGDIVNNADQAYQWTNANASLSIYDTVPSLPFGLCVGNHDEYPNGTAGGTGAFNTYFPYTRYAGRSWYGGHMGTTNDNHYILFTAGGMDFVAIHMAYNPSPTAELAWAAGVLQTYSNRRAIVVVHSILNVDASWTTQGLATYNALKSHPNLFLMLCGHNHGEARRTDTAASTIYSVLADYQSLENGGDGYLRILQFVPTDNAINVTTYSPTLDVYQTESDSQFALSYDMGGAAFAELATITGVPSDSDVSFTWTNVDPLKICQWYAAVSDGHTTTTMPVQSFNTVPSGPGIGLSPVSFNRTGWVGHTLSSDTFNVTNTGIGTLNYTISGNASWLSTIPSSGSLTGGSAPIGIVYDTTGLSTGTYTAAITVSDPAAWNNPRTINVTLHLVTVKPDFDLDGDVDQTDFAHLQLCLTGSGGIEAGCSDADLNSDTRIDSFDVGILQRCLSGANQPAVTTCAQ